MKKLCSILAGLMAGLGATQLSAVTVTNLNDSGPGSFRAALEAGGNIGFAVAGTITLTSGELVVSHPTTITGPGAEHLIIARSSAAGTPAFRVLRVNATPVTISGLTLSNGLVAPGSDNGAGILNQGTLTLSNCVVRGNRSTAEYARGTGLFNANEATLSAYRCVFTENVGTGEYAEGGGIYVYGVANLNDCTISGNRGEGYYSRGGGLHVDYYGSAGVARCTFSSNSVTGLNAQGGGIYNYGRLEIVNSTLAGNHSGETGGGIHVDSLAPNTAIRNCTISGNTSRTTGAGLSNYGFTPHSTGPRTIKDSIIAGNVSTDIENAGVITSSGHNLFGLISGNAVAAGAGDHFGVTAAALKLAPLANNGGPTQTRALLAGSPAIDAGNPTSFPATDQRGVARPFGWRSDIGAFELDVILPPVVTVRASRTNTLEAGLNVDPAPGEFIISRTGSTNEPLQVFLRFSGTASNGLDYQFLSNSVTIPAGQSSAEMLVLGLFDGLVEGTETVILNLEAPACLAIYPPPPGCYAVGTSTEAVVKILDYEHPTNQPPTVTIVVPTNGAAFTAPATIQICADARDADGYVDFVEFFAGTNRIGSRTNCLPCAYIQNPFCLIWTNVPPGEYSLTAKVTDNLGASKGSEPVQVVVRSSGSNNLSFRLAFNNPNANAGVFFRNYTLAGPVDGDRLLPADRVLAAGGDRYYYGAKPHIVWRADRDTGAILELNPGPDLPELSWPTGVAFDSHRSRVVLTSLGGEGFFYAYSTTSNRWSLVRSQDNRDLDCLEYHKALDAFFGVKVLFGDGGPGTIYRFSASGEFQGEIALPTFPFGIGPTGYRSELVSLGDYLVLLLENDGLYNPYGESRIYLIDPRNGSVQLTYQQFTPRPNQPPSVQINSPIAGQMFSAPAAIQLVAYAEDPEDGNNLKVEFFAGDHSLGLGTFVPSLCPSPYCPNYTLTWSNVPPGEYSLTARATDSNATTTVSAPATVTVYDSALSLVAIRATDASASEAGGTGTFTVSREGNTNSVLHVFYSISGTASNGVDYLALSNSVLLAEGVQAATIQISPVNDALFESTERVELRLLPPPFYLFPYLVGSPSNAVVEIADNDEPPPLPVVTVEATDATASETPGNPGQFRVRRTGSTNQSLTVYWTISGTASNGVDYARLTNIVLIPAGRSAVEFPVTPVNDLLVESNESVAATLYYPPTVGPFPVPLYTIGMPSNAVVTILDNDSPVTNLPPLVRISTPTNGTTFTLPANIEICAWAGGSNRYVTTVEFFAGDTRLGIRTNPCPPPCVNVMAQLYCVAWSNPPSGTHTLTAKANFNEGAGAVSAPVEISVLPLPPLPVVSLEATDPEASETPGHPGQFRLYRTGPTNLALPVHIAYTGTASNGVDFARLTNLVTIPAGRLSLEINVSPVDDNLVEGSETVVATLHHSIVALPPTYSIGSPSNAVVTILDNDPTVPPFVPAVVTVEATDAEAAETGLLGVVNSGVFTLHRSGNTNPTLHVQCVIEGTAANGLDYIALSNIVVIPAGATSAKVFVYPLTDNLSEGTETVRLILQSPFCIAIYPPPPECYQVGSPGAATVHIADKPETNIAPVVTLIASDPTASEGTNCYRWVGWSNPPPANFCGTNTATFVVRRTGSTNASLSVAYESGGTASNGVDYVTLSGHVIIPAGGRTAEIRILPLDDAARERTETIVLALISPPVSSNVPPPYLLGVPRRAGAVLADNDEPRPGTGPLPDHGFHLTRPGTNGAWFRIEYSTNLVHWTALCTNSVTDGAIHFVDPDATTAPSRFYRAVAEPNPPAE